MYDFGDKKYCNKKRWGTYYEQLKRAIDREYKSYLIIGPGDNIVPIVLKQICPNAVVETYDIKDVTATYMGDVCDFDSVVGDKTWECVICCQVLEHVEFSNFVHILDMISSHTDKKMVISLPKKINKFMTIYHKWEIGSIEDIKTSSDIKNILSKYGDVTVENITDSIFIFDIFKK